MGGALQTVRHIATATVSVVTLEFGQPNKNHHFKIFAQSVATATFSVDTLFFFCINLQLSLSVCLY